MRIHHADKMGAANRHDLDNHRCYHGHFGTLLSGILDPGIPTVTLLRDPYEHTVSLLKHTVRMLANTQPEWARPYLHRLSHSTFPLLAFLLVSLNRRYLRNFQTRWLGVDIDFDRLTKRNGKLGRQLVFPDHALPEVLEKAKRRLDSMAVVGTVDGIDEFVQKVFTLFGVPAPEVIAHLNVGYGLQPGHSHRKSTALPPFLVRRIDEITRYDQELYAYACELARRPRPVDEPTCNVHGN